MFSLKRSRLAHDDDDDDGEDEISETENALSASRPETRKRSRPSEDLRYDEISDSTTDEELELLQATQFQQRQRRRKVQENKPADNGIVESVTCSNFMCHGYLQVDVGPLINFVIGHNGSGKSAVLTALTICLGGKASSTNRAGSLKAFIKEGQESCTLSVKLKNRGDTGYQPELYGDSIIVERHFNKAGSSGFRLRSATGRLVSTRRSDLEDISDYFALQLDNPMSVLSQDMARQFLNNSSPSEKYKFFIKGVQLEQLNHDYQLLEESIDAIEATFADKRELINTLATEVAAKKELSILSDKHENLRLTLRKLSRQMAWAQVEEQEEFLASYDNDIRKASDKIGDIDVKIATTSDNYRQAVLALGIAQTALKDVMNDLLPLTDAKARINEEKKGITAENAENHAEQRRIGTILRAEGINLEKIKKNIVEENRRLDEVNGGSHIERLAEIDKRRKEAEDAKTNVEVHNRVLKSLQAKQEGAENALDRHQSARRVKADEIQVCKAQLETLQKDRGQRRSGYPTNMNTLLQAISQDSGFQQKPIGPLGNSLRLQTPQWSSILEKSFGGTLNSFVVTSKSDQSRLFSIMKGVNCQCPILIGNNNLFNYSNSEPDEEFATILRVLQIDNPVVTRQLIISNGVEQTILIEDMAKARELLNQSRPKNVKACFSMNNKAANGAGVRISYGFDSALSSSFLVPYQGVPRIKTDIEYQISAVEGALQCLKSEQDHLGRENRELQMSLDDCKNAIKRHAVYAKELKSAQHCAEGIVDKIQDGIDQDAVQEGRLDVLKKSLVNAEDEIKHLETAYGDTVIQKDKYRKDLKESLEKATAIDVQIAEVEEKKREAQDIELKESDQRNHALHLKNVAVDDLAAANDALQELREGRTEKLDRVSSFIEQATIIGPRIAIEIGDTANSLDKKLQKLTRDLKMYQDKLGGDKQKIVHDYAQASKAYDDAFRQFQGEEKLAQMLKMTLVNRQYRWTQFKRRITARSRMMFQYLLSERAFKGKVSVDHKVKLLSLNVQPDVAQSNAGGETHGLSGGEKSFSTICLLLSLWEAMGAPIRGLDEFDVFMDSVNRDVSMRMLVDFAKRSVGRQFIFITPQSMNAVDRDQDVKIIKMQDPERNQTTLNFGGT